MIKFFFGCHKILSLILYEYVCMYTPKTLIYLKVSLNHRCVNWNLYSAHLFSCVIFHFLFNIQVYGYVICFKNISESNTNMLFVLSLLLRNMHVFLETFLQIPALFHVIIYVRIYHYGCFLCYCLSLSYFCSIGSGPYLNAEFKMPRTKSKWSLMTFPRCATKRVTSTTYETIHLWGKSALFDKSYVAWWQW